MSAKFRIQGGAGGVASVAERKKRPHGLVTYTHPYDHYRYSIQPLVNDTYGADMAIDPAVVTPTTTLIHNGEDTTAWTAAAVTGGGFNFTSTAQAYDGTQSIDASVSSNNDVAGFTAPAPLNPSSFSALLFAVYITSFPNTGTKDVAFQFYNGGSPVGNVVSIKPYVNTNNFNTWQLANIPLGDFGLTATPQIDELRITTVDQGRGAPPNYFLDKIELADATTGSGVQTYRFEPPFNEDYSLLRLRLFAYNTSKTDPNPTEFFGLPALAGGLELVLRNKRRVFLSLIAQDIWDLIRGANAEVRTNADGSTGATFIVDFDIPMDHMLIEGTEGTFIEVRVKDDLSALERFEVSCHLALLEDE